LRARQILTVLSWTDEAITGQSGIFAQEDDGLVVFKNAMVNEVRVIPDQAADKAWPCSDVLRISLEIKWSAFDHSEPPSSLARRSRTPALLRKPLPEK
jgi:hypothetical protein